MDLQNKINPEILKTAVRTGLVRWTAVLAVSVIFAVFIIRVPLVILLQSARNDVFMAHQKLEKIAGIAGGQQSIDEVLDRLDAQFRQLKMQMLRPGEQSRVISLLTQATNDLSISILNIEDVKLPEPKGDEPLPPVRPRMFDVEMITRYKTLGQFFDTLDKSPMILRTEKLKVRQKTENSVFLNVTLRLAAYEETFL